jgi:4-carboxymuconolactone decarboxylase
MSNPPVPSAKERVRQIAPKFIQLTDDVLFGDVWERPGLSKRDRSMITVAALVATYRPEQLRHHMERALGNGVTQEEIVELITHVAFYAGWPAGFSAANVAVDLFSKKSPEPQSKRPRQRARRT